MPGLDPPFRKCVQSDQEAVSGPFPAMALLSNPALDIRQYGVTGRFAGPPWQGVSPAVPSSRSST